MVLSKSTPVATKDKVSFLLLDNIPFDTYVPHLHSPIHRHVCCFHILAVVNTSNAAMRVGIHVSFRISVFFFGCLFLDNYAEVGLLGGMVVLFLVF